MAIARASDRVGDKSACERAIENAEGAIVLMMQSDNSKTRNEPSKRKELCQREPIRNASA